MPFNSARVEDSNAVRNMHVIRHREHVANAWHPNAAMYLFSVQLGVPASPCAVSLPLSLLPSHRVAWSGTEFMLSPTHTIRSPPKAKRQQQYIGSLSAFASCRHPVTTLQMLTDDILLLIISFIEVRDILALRQVSGMRHLYCTTD